MAGIDVAGFNHTGISVSDLQRSVAFFTEVLGFELVSIAPRDPEVVGAISGLGYARVEIAYLKGHGHTLELLAFAEPEGRAQYRTSDAGAMHIALDILDMAAAVAACEPWGWQLMGEVVAIDNGPNKGRKIAYLYWESENIILEFIQRPG
ncbi:VOC family protein [Geminicoccaceae bacterium 1502E]|nr:VOC family protein [Geminicoccaceae bacterium 1502E]